MDKDTKQFFLEQLDKQEQKFERYMGALMEKNDDSIQAIGEQVDMISQKQDDLKVQMGQMEQRQDRMEVKLNDVEVKLDNVVVRIDAIDQTLDEHTSILKANQETLLEHDDAIEQIKNTVYRLEVKFDKIDLADLAKRIHIIEEKVL